MAQAFFGQNLEDAGTPYVDVARLPEAQGGGASAIMRVLRGEHGGLLPLAPPVLRVGALTIAQVANILQYLGPRCGLAPDDEAGRLAVNQLQLTIADLVSEVHDTHHPISVGGVTVRPGDLVVGDADGVTVIEREKAAAMLPLAAEKVAAETKRIADIKSRKALRPGWLDGALRAAGVIKEGESL